jgi:hypothetical protein
MIFKTNLTERMRITAGGDVGIGTSSPGARLDASRGHTTNGLAGVVAFPQFAVTNPANWGYPAGMLFRAPLTDGGAVANNAAIWSQWESDNNSHVALATTGSGTLAERMRIDSSGNVGIGCVPLSVTRFQTSIGTDRRFSIFLNGSDSVFGFLTDAGSWADTFLNGNPLRFGVNGTERMRIDSSGNVGIGITAPSARVHASIGSSGNTLPGNMQGIFESFGNNGIAVSAPASDTGGLYFPRSTVPYYAGVERANTALVFRNNDTERARIDSSGNLLVGKTATSVSTTGTWIGSGNINITSGNASGDFVMGFYNTGSASAVGSIQTTASATNFNTSSDARLKHDIVDAPEASGLIDAIKVRSFKWNADDSEQRYGFVAQELVEVAPEAVSVPADEDQMMGVDYSKLVPMLVKEIQSLRARVAQLEGN